MRRRVASLLRGLPLEEGSELLTKWGAESVGDANKLLPAFIEESSGYRRLLRAGLTTALVLVIGVISALYGYAEIQRQKTYISLLLAESRNALLTGDVSEALSSARKAVDAQDSTATRSAFLGALMRVSPYLVAAVDTGGAAPQGIEWTDSRSLVYVDATNKLRGFFLAPGAGDWVGRTIIARHVEERPPVVVNLQRLKRSELEGVLSDGSLVRLFSDGKQIQLYEANPPR